MKPIEKKEHEEAETPEVEAKEMETGEEADPSVATNVDEKFQHEAQALIAGCSSVEQLDFICDACETKKSELGGGEEETEKEIPSTFSEEEMPE